MDLELERGEAHRIRNGELCFAGTYENETACITLSALNVFLAYPGPVGISTGGDTG